MLHQTKCVSRGCFLLICEFVKDGPHPRADTFSYAEKRDEVARSALAKILVSVHPAGKEFLDNYILAHTGPHRQFNIDTFVHDNNCPRANVGN